MATRPSVSPQQQPRFWRTLCRYWNVDDQQQQQTWQAIATAQGSVPKAWYDAVWEFEAQPRQPTPEDVEAFLLTSTPPAKVIAVLEALADEGKLTRQEVSALEEHVFQMILPSGEWR
jgi:hypothetical protein